MKLVRRTYACLCGYEGPMPSCSIPIYLIEPGVEHEPTVMLVCPKCGTLRARISTKASSAEPSQP